MFRAALGVVLAAGGAPIQILIHIAVRKKVFIDGQEGTTGLGIHQRLAGRTDVELLEIPTAARKDPAAKRAILAAADVAILCLPDVAAVETVALARDLSVKLIDASTAHRTNDAFAYGLPELAPEQRAAIASARFVANPGCYPTGFLLAVRPLVDAGIVPVDYPITVHALSGYSGGGKKMIQAFREHDHRGESPDWTARPYALTLAHKHVAEMHVFGKFTFAPLFCPIVGNYYQGMIVTVPLHVRALKKRASLTDVHEVLAARYAGEGFVRVLPVGGGDAVEGGLLSPTACNGTNSLELLVSGNDEQILVSARLDNLGKGASGAAVQNLNLMLGFDESAGLT
ncbi:MAG TPA: N-acetyl-gamma-glutamyl-phosphate reductase [Polyangiaceae bacterium]|jgi:N-acetyl-gamma-glutamyl-phosphate reductase|nr:N-acetyl-gamma-glutamyl-phosphate reductase [Polyangiaceae bacterium]